MPNAIELTATVLFAVAVIHTFCVSVFARRAARGGRHAGLWHLLSEVEVVFGVWAFVLLAAMAAWSGADRAIAYMDGRDFTEPAFVFVVMVVAASRPILALVDMLVRGLARVLPLRGEVATFFLTLSLVPLAGSFITEPAAMTLAALLLRDACFRHGLRPGLKYLTLGVLFVNISIGGVLTVYAAPAVLMAARAFGWDTSYMAVHFGWRAAIAVFVNAGLLTLVCARALPGRVAKAGRGRPEAAGRVADDVGGAGTGTRVDVGAVAGSRAASGDVARPAGRPPMPPAVMGVHLLFLAGVVLSAHHPAIFLSLLMLFIGYTEAYKRHQDPLMIKEGLMVGFFLAGLVVLGGMQGWWLQDLLAGLDPIVLYWGAAALTAVTDNAALTYLGSLVSGTGETWRYMLVAGAVTGGGLTVIANAPNPAGFALLKRYFPDGAISPGKLLLAAAVPTLIAACMFLL